MSMPIASGVPPEAYVGMAAQPLDAMRPVLEAFWDTYATTRGFDEARRVRANSSALHALWRRPAVWSAIEQRLYVSQVDSLGHGAAAGESQRARETRRERSGSCSVFDPSATRDRPA